jgi:hypothetical protein
MPSHLETRPWEIANFLFYTLAMLLKSIKNPKTLKKSLRLSSGKRRGQTHLSCWILLTAECLGAIHVSYSGSPWFESLFKIGLS